MGSERLRVSGSISIAEPVMIRPSFKDRSIGGATVDGSDIPNNHRLDV